MINFYGPIIYVEIRTVESHVHTKSNRYSPTALWARGWCVDA